MFFQGSFNKKSNKLFKQSDNYCKSLLLNSEHSLPVKDPSDFLMAKNKGSMNKRTIASLFNKAHLFSTPVLLIAVLGIITLYPVVLTGYTTNDDMNMAIEKFGYFQESFLNPAKIQGRFNFLLTVPLSRVPFLIENPIYFHLFRTGSTIVAIASFSLLLSHIFASAYIGFLSSSIFLILVQNNWDHNALTSYPFVFNFIFICFIISFYFFTKFLKNNIERDGIISGAFFFVAMMIESFALFLILFGGVSFVYKYKFGAYRGRKLWGEVFRSLKWLLRFFGLYLIFYVSWRTYFNSSYDGNTLSFTDLKLTIRVIYELSCSAFPFASLRLFFNPEKYAVVSAEYAISTLGLIKGMQIEWLIKALVSFCLIFFLLKKLTRVQVKNNLLWYALGLFFIFIFLPNILLGFTPKYKNWILNGVDSYVYTYYSLFGFVGFVSILVLLGLNTTKNRSSLSICYSLVMAFSFSFLAFVVEVSNSFYFKDQRLSHSRWVIVSKFLNSSCFKTLNNGDFIYGPSLFTSTRGIAAINSEYWSDYIFYKTKKKIKVISSADELKNTNVSNFKLYYMKFFQEPVSYNQILIYSEIKDPYSLIDGIAASHEFVIYSLSKNKRMTMLGSWRNKKASQFDLEINGIADIQDSSGIFITELFFERGVREVYVKSSEQILLETVMFSYYMNQPTFTGLSYETGEGFYTWELSRNGNSRWIWSSGNAHLLLINSGIEKKTAILKMKLSAFMAQKITFRLGTFSKTFDLRGSQRISIEFPLILDTGTSYLEIITNRQGISPGNGDSRKLAFSVSDLKLL